MPGPADFNSKIVRLKEAIKDEKWQIRLDFNSKIVRLKAEEAKKDEYVEIISILK